MPSDLRGLNRFGGIALIASGLLFFLNYVLDLVSGPPPSAGADILAWRTSNELAISISNEVVFFAAALLIPAVVALYANLASVDRVKTVGGAGLIAVVIPVTFMLLIVQGRLVFPVYGLQTDTAAVAELVVAIYYGGLHAIGLLLGLATILLSLAMRRAGWGTPIVALGIATGIFDGLNAYPEAIGPALVALSQVLFAAWFLVVGAKLYELRQEMPAHRTVRATASA